MTAALMLLLGAAIVAVGLPTPLRGISTGRVDPVVALVCWFLSVAGVLGSAGAAVLLLLLPGHGGAAALSIVVGSCWATVRHGEIPRMDDLLGVAGLLTLLALLSRLVLVGTRSARRRRHHTRHYLDTLRIVGHFDPARGTIWLDHDQPVAFSIAGRPGVVVASRGLSHRLSQQAIGAVLAHERAHLTGRHHLQLAVADALAAALPFVPLFRHARTAVRELVELAADLSAIRQHGVDAVRSALLGVTAHGVPDQALAMGRDRVELRLAHLQRHTRPPTTAVRAVACTAAGLASAILPLLTAVALLTALAIVACPLAVTS